MYQCVGPTERLRFCRPLGCRHCEATVIINTSTNLEFWDRGIAIWITSANGFKYQARKKNPVY